MSLPADSSFVYDAAKAGGLLALLYAIGRGVRWVFEFCVGRIDKRQEALAMREQAFERKLNERVSKLEQELAIYREATMLLVNALASKDPSNPALQQVARLLRNTIPLPSPDPELEETMRRAAKALDDADGKA